MKLKAAKRTKSHFFASRFHSHDTSGTKKNPKVARDGHKIAENRTINFGGTILSMERTFQRKKYYIMERTLRLPKLISGLSLIAGTSDFPWLL